MWFFQLKGALSPGGVDAVIASVDPSAPLQRAAIAAAARAAGAAVAAVGSEGSRSAGRDPNAPAACGHHRRRSARSGFAKHGEFPSGDEICDPNRVAVVGSACRNSRIS